jgi:diguanylate cyclase (GGDEF)-like protein
MHDLKACYRQGLTARIGALEAARRGLRDQVADAGVTVRRLAHALRGSGGTYGFPEISAAAARVEDALEESLDAEVDNLLQILLPITTTECAQVGILVVEDDADMARALQMRLAAPNRVVFIAGSIAVAERILADNDIALIVLDLVLPDCDGRTLLIRLRERPGLAALPVIVLSGKSGGTPQKECFALGADAYFEKPVDLDTVAAAVATRLQRTGEVNREARQDPLTGLPNRAAFREACERARSLARRTREPLSLAILDLDRFKSVNDRHGHPIGDQVLRAVATVLTRSLRASDMVARWGGEEFVVLLPNAGQKGAVQALERALDVMREQRFTGKDGAPFSVTFSAGVVPYPEDAMLEEAVNAADRRLYLAKVAGRNRILGAETDNSSPPPCKILFASNDFTQAATARDFLAAAGLEVSFIPGNAPTVLAGIDAATAVIILDVRVLALDGEELLRQLLPIAKAQSIPIVVLADSSAEQDIVRAFDLGADDYLVKPFSAAELVARVRRLLRRH